MAVTEYQLEFKITQDGKSFYIAKPGLEPNISKDELAILYETAVGSRMTVAFVDGTRFRDMERFGAHIGNIAREAGCVDVRTNGLHELAFPSANSILDCPPSRPTICVVNNVHTVENSLMRTALAHMDTAPDTVHWLLVVPTWENFRRSEVLNEYIQEGNYPRFSVELPKFAE